MGGMKPSETDVLVMEYLNDPDTVNALTANDTTSQEFQGWVYDSLATRDFHDPDKLVAGLAESWEFDKEQLEYTIHLRRGVKWHPMSLPDGTALPDEEFSADDVMFTYACILNPSVEAAAARSYYEDPDAKDESERYKIRPTKVDDYTVKVKWTKPYFLADEFTLATSKTGVFAGGDIVTGAATVILAMGAGKTGARSIDRYLQGLPLLTAEEEAC